MPAEARQYISTIERRYSELESRYESLEEEYRLLVFRRFGRSAEKIETNQPELFSEAERESAGEDRQDESIVVAEHSRRRRGRKPLDEHLPRVEILHDIAEEEKHCACGHELVRIGEEVSERLAVIPEQMYVERHIRPKYACHHCEGSADEEKPAVRIAPAPPSLIPGSIVTPGLLAFILVNKFCDHLPFYRQEARFARIGVEISRQDMSNWTIRAAKAMSPLITKFRDLIRAGPVVNMDETPVQVLDEPDRANTTKSFMWLARGGVPFAPVCLYHYEPSRGTEYPRSLLTGYRGFLQVDALRTYKVVAGEEPGIVLVGCWAHVRRRFFEATKGSKKPGSAHEGLSFVSKLYGIERKLREEELDEQEFLRRRREEAEPHLEQFRVWLGKKSETVVPKSLLGKAVAYTLAEWEHLVRYLDHPALTPDNNAAENAIRPFVLGRKNWLFSGSPRGADASCAIYSLIETAKMNGLDPYAYLYYLLWKVPLIQNDEEWNDLLPANLDAESLKAFYLAEVR